MTSTNKTMEKVHKIIADSIYFVGDNGKIHKMINLTSSGAQQEKAFALRNISVISDVFLDMVTEFTEHWKKYKQDNPKADKLYLSTKVMDTISNRVKKSYFILAVIIQAVAILKLPYTIAPLTNDINEISDGAMLVERGTNA